MSMQRTPPAHYASDPEMHKQPEKPDLFKSRKRKQLDYDDILAFIEKKFEQHLGILNDKITQNINNCVTDAVTTTISQHLALITSSLESLNTNMQKNSTDYIKINKSLSELSERIKETEDYSLETEKDLEKSLKTIEGTVSCISSSQKQGLKKIQRRNGGGVLVAVRRELPAVAGRRATPFDAPTLPRTAHTHTDSHSFIDHVLIELKMRNYCCIISATYLPPAMSPELYATHLNYLENLLQSPNVDSFIVVGDFNLPTLEWYESKTHLKPVITSDSNESNIHMINFVSLLNCAQVNTFKNERGRILDLFLTNIHDCGTSLAAVPLVPIMPHHPPFYVLVPMCNRFKPLRALPKQRYNYRKADYSRINKEINAVDWIDLLKYENAEDADEILKELRALDPTKGAGVDGILPIFFKETAPSICPPLHIIFNCCLSEGTFELTRE
ncbi:unnamed protein product [Arctia plantaginis]|uniref:Endonuclease/exonuclease/phosphatase domain-containing protein n=1 Tax=Arctia plantaginis TaxID=874455 RepID=A0A8S1BIR1_ARCPL|nr:unnamed protein product [Arctia plantaginis]